MEYRLHITWNHLSIFFGGVVKINYLILLCVFCVKCKIIENLLLIGKLQIYYWD